VNRHGPVVVLVDPDWPAPVLVGWAIGDPGGSATVLLELAPVGMKSTED
jgi:hypothetical protein